jgi:replication factor C subunit 2/4
MNKTKENNNIITNNIFISKYKPTRFSDFDTPVEIIALLNKYIQYDKLHVLLIGQEGVGKSVLLNTIVKEYYNQIEWSVYKNNVLAINDIQEQGLSYFRNEVKYFCQTCSVIPNKHKILVLDNVDLLSDIIQQIIVSLIDKHKHQVHFIASCTNIHKISDNLQSRLVLIKIPSITQEQLYHISHKIIHNENIQIDSESMDLLITLSNKRINCLINYLEKIKIYNKPINLELVTQICVHLDINMFNVLIEHIRNKQLMSAIQHLYTLHLQGFSVIDILDYFYKYIKLDESLEELIKYNIIQLICKYITIFYNIHEDEIELSLFVYELYILLNGPS